MLQEAEGRAEFRCRQALARLHEIEEAELLLEQQVEANSATKDELRADIQRLQGEVEELRWASLSSALPPCGHPLI